MKNYDVGDLIVLALVGLIVGTVLGWTSFSFVSDNQNDAMRKRAVESDLGHYNSKTADWEWNTPKLKYTITGRKAK